MGSFIECRFIFLDHNLLATLEKISSKHEHHKPPVNVNRSMNLTAAPSPCDDHKLRLCSIREAPVKVIALPQHWSYFFDYDGLVSRHEGGYVGTSGVQCVDLGGRAAAYQLPPSTPYPKKKHEQR